MKVEKAATGSHKPPYDYFGDYKSPLLVAT